MLSAAEGIIAGQSGFVAYTTDSGRTFTPIQSNFSRQISDVQILSASEALGITWTASTSQLRHTADTGRTWTILAEGNFIRRMDRDDSGAFWFYGTNNNIFKANTSTSLTELKKWEVMLWPNPTHQHFFIQSQQSILKGTLMNAVGQPLLLFETLEPGQHHIQLPSNLAQGVYLLQLESKSGKTIKRIILR